MPDELQQYHTENIILILSRLPEFLRESMMRSRLQDLCQRFENKRRFHRLDTGRLSLVEKDSLKKVIRTWLGEVSKLQGNEISTIFLAFVNKFEKDPSLYENDHFASLLEAYLSLEENQRIVLRDCLFEALINQPRGRQIILTLPKKGRSALHLR